MALGSRSSGGLSKAAAVNDLKDRRLMLRPCLEAAVSLKTQEQYGFYLAKLSTRARRRGLEIPWDNWIKLDLVLAEYIEELARSGMHSGDGEKSLAAVVFEVADLRKADLRVASLALKGFQKLCPARSRPPLPEDVTAALAAILAIGGAREAALWVLTAHFGYFRPGEVFNFLKEDLVGPVTDARTSLAAPILIVAPEERLVKSKAQTLDDSVRCWSSSGPPASTARPSSRWTAPTSRSSGDGRRRCWDSRA